MFGTDLRLQAWKIYPSFGQNRLVYPIGTKIQATMLAAVWINQRQQATTSLTFPLFVRGEERREIFLKLMGNPEEIARKVRYGALCAVSLHSCGITKLLCRRFSSPHVDVDLILKDEVPKFPDIKYLDGLQ